MMASGYWSALRIAGIPLRVHWTLPIGIILLGGLRPMSWVELLAIVLIHELGHAWVVRRQGLRVVSLDLTGLGGVCRWSGDSTADQRGRIAWGGVLAQGVLALVAGLLAGAAALGGAPWISEELIALERANLLIIGLNLLPFGPFDGAVAWPFLLGTRAKFRGRRWLDGWRNWWARRHGRRLVAQVLRTKVSPGSEKARSSPPPPSPDAIASRELADLLRKISEDAGRLRRGKSP